MVDLNTLYVGLRHSNTRAYPLEIFFLRHSNLQGVKCGNLFTCFSRQLQASRRYAMDETGQEEMRPGSGDSENGSENGFVQVTREDARLASQGVEGFGEGEGSGGSGAPPIPAVEDDEDLYGGPEDQREGEGLEEEKVGMPHPNPWLARAL